jgi:NAD(P)-dependent dehydrogenase (short-subunit alcohol dehydrogenase family)
MQRFEGMTVVVTGAASGLGRDAAIALAGEGARRLVLMDVDEAGLRATVAEAGPRADALVCNVAEPDALAGAWSGLEFPEGLDVLLTAAGTIGSGSAIADCGVDEWDRIFAINVRGTFLCIQHALPHLRRQRGCIVTYGSTAGLAGSGALAPYSASKGAVVMLTRSLAIQHATEGIRANCVCPGSIDTPMLQATFETAGDAQAVEARRALYLSLYPMGRFGASHEVTQAAQFLASREASYVTGVALPVDGGRLA